MQQQNIITFKHPVSTEIYCVCVFSNNIYILTILRESLTTFEMIELTMIVFTQDNGFPSNGIF